MKNILLLSFILIVGFGTANACEPNECSTANLCYTDGGISCTQNAKCNISNGHQTWVPLTGTTNICGGHFTMTIIEATWKAQADSRTGTATDVVGTKCNEKEVCDFIPKADLHGTGGLLGNVTPGSHYDLKIKYICRRPPNDSKGVVSFVHNNDLESVNFNCIE